jgi:transposase
MQALQKWMMDQLIDRKIEPNSGLGRAITYFLRHWETLTLFLRQPGATETTAG